MEILSSALPSSFGLVAASEMGDKTQLLAFSLAVRFKRPVPILTGILVATLLNHALAAGLGGWIAAHLSPQALKWILGSLFIGFAVWTLKPDELDEADRSESGTSAWAAFATTCVVFFLAEMGDKTQFATMALGARFGEHLNGLLSVVVGTTLGMMLADGLAVFMGQQIGNRIPMQWVRRGAALLFAAFGVATLLG
jgi:Ca2+/H+ antiporter, TMEM165/GDT1 family